MPEMTEVVELLENSESRWRTLRAVGHEWSRHDRLQVAWERMVERNRRSELGRMTLLWSGGNLRPASPVPEQTEEPWKLWCAPERSRAQFHVEGDLVDVVFLGATWWSVGHGWARTNAGSDRYHHGMGDGERLIRTRPYIPFLDFHEVVDGTWRERSAFLVRATPVWGESLHGLYAADQVLHGLLIGDPDEILLTVDAERGVLLRTEARLEGMPYRIVEMEEVFFDEEFGQEVFTIQLPSGQDWMGPDDLAGPPGPFKS
jgi:hypothetical protein